jgi:hypothetical protein
MHRLLFFSASPLSIPLSRRLSMRFSGTTIWDLMSISREREDSHVSSFQTRQLFCLRYLTLAQLCCLCRRISILPLVYVTYLGIPTPPRSAPAIYLADLNGDRTYISSRLSHTTPAIYPAVPMAVHENIRTNYLRSGVGTERRLLRLKLSDSPAIVSQMSGFGTIVLPLS